MCQTVVPRKAGAGGGGGGGEAGERLFNLPPSLINKHLIFIYLLAVAGSVASGRGGYFAVVNKASVRDLLAYVNASPTGTGPWVKYHSS